MNCFSTQLQPPQYISITIPTKQKRTDALVQSVTLSTQKVLPMFPSWPTLQNTPPPTTGPSATHSTVILVSAIKRRTNKIHPTVARLSSRRHSTHKRGPMHSWSNLVCLTLMLYVAFGIIPTYPSRRTTSRGSTR